MGLPEEPEVLEEVSSEYLIDMWYSANILGIHFGWFVLAGVLLLLYFWPQLQSKLDKSYKEKQVREYDAICKKNPDLVRKKEQAMNEARQRMQQELTKKAKEHDEKIKEKEEKQRLERLAQLNNDVGGHTLGSGDKKAKNKFKPDYHPLMGSGSSTSYRPPKRSCCPSSGGCG